MNELVTPLNVTPATDSPAMSSVLAVIAPVSSNTTESPVVGMLGFQLVGAVDVLQLGSTAPVQVMTAARALPEKYGKVKAQPAISNRRLNARC